MGGKDNVISALLCIGAVARAHKKKSCFRRQAIVITFTAVFISFTGAAWAGVGRRGGRYRHGRTFVCFDVNEILPQRRREKQEKRREKQIDRRQINYHYIKPFYFIFLCVSPVSLCVSAVKFRLCYEHVL